LKKHHDADLTLIVTGLTINADDAYGFETYSYYSKNKLYDLIRANKRSGVIFLTRDVHYAIPTASACKDAIGGDIKFLNLSHLDLLILIIVFCRLLLNLNMLLLRNYTLFILFLFI
jgi:hypothetical protein